MFVTIGDQVEAIIHSWVPQKEPATDNYICARRKSLNYGWTSSADTSGTCMVYSGKANRPIQNIYHVQFDVHRFVRSKINNDMLWICQCTNRVDDNGLFYVIIVHTHTMGMPNLFVPHRNSHICTPLIGYFETHTQMYTLFELEHSRCMKKGMNDKRTE